MTHANKQLHVDRKSKKFVTINSHLVLFSYTHMSYGESSATSIFQCVIDRICQGIPNVLCYLDDILITGSSDEQHMHTSDKVLDKLSEAGIYLTQSKCAFISIYIYIIGL